MSWLPLTSGQTFDLVHPTPEMVDFADMAFVLARLPRFLGRTRGLPYSVAQHSVLGADAILHETDDPALAATFLLHDGHEAYIGDIISPVAEALTWFDPAHDGCGLPRLKLAIDDAVYAAAGLTQQRLAAHALIAAMDLRLCRAERDALKGPSKRLWHPLIENARPIPSLPPIDAWSHGVAEHEFRARLRLWLPQTLERAA